MTVNTDTQLPDPGVPPMALAGEYRDWHVPHSMARLICTHIAARMQDAEEALAYGDAYSAGVHAGIALGKIRYLAPYVNDAELARAYQWHDVHGIILRRRARTTTP